MTGIKALELLTNGQKVRRAIWLPRIYAVRTEDNIVTIRDYVRMGKPHQPTQLQVSQLLKDDWELWEVVE
jgi:hypothetical protein